MLVIRSWCGSLMKNSPGDREVPGEKKHRHRAEESSLPSGVEEVHGGGTRHRDASVCHERVLFVVSGIPAQCAELVGREFVPVRGVVPHAANSLGRLEDQAIASSGRWDVD